MFLYVCHYCVAVFCVVCFFLGFSCFCSAFPSVLRYCWLGLLTCKTVSQITYTVLVETLNPAQSISQLLCWNMKCHWCVLTALLHSGSAAICVFRLSSSVQLSQHSLFSHHADDIQQLQLLVHVNTCHMSELAGNSTSDGQ